jgi:hypothetical protein
MVPRTPIAGTAYRWREATGYDDVLMLERGPGLATAVELVARRVCAEDGGPLDAGALPVGDIDAIVVELRRAALGDRLIAEGRCGACDAKVDITFSLVAYMKHRRPRTPRGAKPAEPPWWRSRRYPITFRAPTATDVLETASAGESDPVGALAERCMRGELTARTRRAAERALAVAAPTLRSDVTGTCPECQADVRLDVDARELCLEELRFLGGAVLEDVDLIASEYHWSESEIMGLPSSRRAAYAEYVRAGRGAPLRAEAFGG